MDNRQSDRALVAYLVDKYGLADLISMAQSSTESSFCIPAPNSGWATDTNFLPSAALSASNSPMGRLSDAGSATGSLYSETTAQEPTPSFFSNSATPGRNSSRRSRGGAKAPNTGMSVDLSGIPGVGLSPSSSVKKSKPPVECPFCSELGICITIARKADLKRHFLNFHLTNSQWICSLRGCQMAFDFKSGFDAHLKDSHHGVHLSAEDAVVRTCPQVVFACGFTNCKQVIEAAGDDESDQKAQEYFNHVAKHLDEGRTHNDWSYTVRFKNLLRQRSVQAAWKSRDKDNQDKLAWQSFSTAKLRKILETKHIGDVQLVVQWAVTLGSYPYSQPGSPLPVLPAEISVPLRDTCSMVVAGHKPDRRPDIVQPRPHSRQPHPVLVPQQIQMQYPSQSPATQSHPYGRFQTPPLGDPSHGPFDHQPSNAATPLYHSPSPFTPLDAATYSPQLFGPDASHASPHPLSYWTGIDGLGVFAAQDSVVADLQRRHSGATVSRAPLGQYVAYAQHLTVDDKRHEASAHVGMPGGAAFPTTQSMTGY